MASSIDNMATNDPTECAHEVYENCNQNPPAIELSPSATLNSQRYSYSSTSSDLSNRSSVEVSRESMAAQRQLREMEKKFNDTLNELERAKGEIQESRELNRVHVRKIRQLEQEMGQLKIVNKSLYDENKRVQIMLADKEAEYRKMETLYFEERRKTERHLKSDSMSSTLSDDRETLVGERVHKESDHTLIEELQNEIKTLKDDNESMTLYIQKMLNRIMEVKGFEDTLATNWTSERENKSTPPSTPKTPNTSDMPTTKPTKASFENQPKVFRASRSNSLKTDFKFPNSPTNFDAMDEEKTNQYSDSYSQRSPTIIESSYEEDRTPVTRTRTGNGSSDGKIVQENPKVDVPRRSATTNVVPSNSNLSASNNNNNSSKRISGLFKWSVLAISSARTFAEPSKKEDPYMKPILLVQANEKK